MKLKYNRSLRFDDTHLPVNDLTPERTEEIEKLVMPKLRQAFDKLREEKPHLFKSSRK